MGWSGNSVLRALATLAEDPGQFPASTGSSQLFVTLVLEYPTLSLMVSVSGSM